METHPNERTNMAKRVYVVSYLYRTGACEPKSPFASASVTYSDPSAAHEAALKLKSQGHLSILITPKFIAENP
jgi:hypothetical protein